MGISDFGAGTLQPRGYFTLVLKASSRLPNQFTVHTLHPTATKNGESLTPLS